MAKFPCFRISHAPARLKPQVQAALWTEIGQRLAGARRRAFGEVVFQVGNGRGEFIRDHCSLSLVPNKFAGVVMGFHDVVNRIGEHGDRKM